MRRSADSTARRWRSAAALAGALLALQPAAAELVSSKPARLVLGRDDSAVLEFEIPDADAPGAELRMRANVGRLELPDRVSGTRWQVTYHLPTTRHPQVVLLVAWWANAGPEAPSTAMRIRLSGTSRVPVSTRPRSSVVVRAGSTRYGPVRADGSGNAVVPVVVPPGLREVVVEVTDEVGATSTRTVRIETSAYPRDIVIAVPERIDRPQVSWSRIEVHHVSPRLSAERVTVESEGGAVSPLPSDAPGLRYRFVPGRSVSGGVSVSVATAPKAEPTVLQLAVTGEVSRRPDGLYLGARGGIGLPGYSAGLRVLAEGGIRGLGVEGLRLGLALGGGGVEPRRRPRRTSEGSTRLMILELEAGYSLLELGPVGLAVGLLAGFDLGFFRAVPGPETAAGAGPRLGGFGEAELAVGPATLFLDVRGVWAQLRADEFRANAGGLEIVLGFRIGLDGVGADR